ncbi:unnamed protein product [Lasius platythorax]|uniref:Uncharacterized protein n=1 Tax=Lasius platythorax TaxID=488582 RepID=A0AAV2N4A3_9HYME
MKQRCLCNIVISSEAQEWAKSEKRIFVVTPLSRKLRVPDLRSCHITRCLLDAIAIISYRTKTDAGIDNNALYDMINADRVTEGVTQETSGSKLAGNRVTSD